MVYSPGPGPGPFNLADVHMTQTRAFLLTFALSAIPCMAPDGMAAQEVVEVAGTVLDDGTGEPVDGATVRLADASGSARETITGPDGAFAFAQVAPGAYALAVRRFGYELLSTPLEIGAQEPPRLDVRLTPQAIPLEPLEVGVEGRPPRLVESGFYDRMEEGWGTFFEPAWVEANKVGYTFLADFLPNLQMRAPEFRCAEVPVYYDRVQVGLFYPQNPSARHDPAEKRWPAKPAVLGELSVSDLGAAEFYTPQSKIPFFAWNDTTMECGAIILWSDWTAHLADIPKIDVKLCEPGGRPGEVALDGIVEDEITEVRLPAATVSARYTPSEALDRRQLEVRTDSLGRYRVCDLPEGTAVELAAKYGPHAARQSVVAVAAAGGEEMRLTVPVTPPASIIGMVLNEATSALIEGARIVLVDTDFRTVTNAAGRFSLEDLPPGSYRIRAVCAGYTGSVHEVELAEGGNVAVVLRLRATDLARRGTCSI